MSYDDWKLKEPDEYRYCSECGYEVCECAPEEREAARDKPLGPKPKTVTFGPRDDNEEDGPF